MPLTPGEIAEQAKAVGAAGADELHIHPRTPIGEETLDPAHVAACLSAVRNAVPNMPVGVGTGTWIAPTGRARHRLIREWSVRPDYASVNLNEQDAPDVMDLLIDLGVGIEAGVWDAQDAQRLTSLPQRDRCLRILIEMTSDNPHEATATYRECVGILRQADLDLPILLHGEGGSLWPMIDLALVSGHDTRVGLEDGLYLPDGTPATNEAMVRHAASSLSHPASIDEI